MTKALHLGGLRNTNIICRYLPPSFPGSDHRMQGNYLYFSLEIHFPAER